ncbi:MAG: LiaF domain-containing protein [Acidimicrobiia bacterium]
MRIVRRLIAMWIGLWAAAVAVGAVVRFTAKPLTDPTAPSFNLVTVFDGTEFRPTTSMLGSSRCFTMFGGTQLDLRRASTTASRVLLDVTTVIGGTDITVPDTWKVTVEGPTVAGGREVQVREHDELAADAPHLVIHARTCVGGLRVASRPVIAAAAG